jgi:hypothetical protein
VYVGLGGWIVPVCTLHVDGVFVATPRRASHATCVSECFIILGMRRGGATEQRSVIEKLLARGACWPLRDCGVAERSPIAV